MRKQQKQKRDLWSRYQQVQHMKLSGSILYDAGYVYYTKWEQINHATLSQISDQVLKIDKKYFQHTIQDEQISYTKDEKGEFIPSEGMTKEMWKEEFETIMDEPCTFYV